MKKGVRSGPWNGIGSLNSRTRISRLIGALHTGLTQKTVWYTEHAREEGEGSGGREGRQARGGVGGVAMAGGVARGGQPGKKWGQWVPKRRHWQQRGRRWQKAGGETFEREEME